MRDRQLLRTKTTNASVIGLVPEDILTVIDQAETPTTTTTTSGGIDVESNLAYVLSVPNPNTTSTSSNATLRIWKHETYALAEDIVAYPEDAVRELIHPKFILPHPKNRGEVEIRYERLLAFLPDPSSSSSSSGGDNGVTVTGSLYWCSPNGYLAYYSNLSSDSYTTTTTTTTPSSSPPPPSSSPSSSSCDTAMELPLTNGEYVTILHHTYHDPITRSGGIGAGVVLIGTSHNRTFRITKNNRPLELTVRLLFDSPLLSSGEVADTEHTTDRSRGDHHTYDRVGTEDEGEETGGSSSRNSLVGDLYARLFTPHKTPKKRSMENRTPPPPPPTSTVPRRGYGGVHTPNNRGIIGLFTHPFVRTTNEDRSPVPKSRRIAPADGLGSAGSTTSSAGITGGGGGGSVTTAVYAVSRDGTIITDLGDDGVGGTRRRSRSRRNRNVFSLLTAMEGVWETEKEEEEEEDGGDGGDGDGGDGDVRDHHHFNGDEDDGSSNESSRRRRRRRNKEETLSSVEVLECAYDAADSNGGDHRTERSRRGVSSPPPASLVVCLRLTFVTNSIEEEKGFGDDEEMMTQIGEEKEGTISGRRRRSGRVYLVRCPIDPEDGLVKVVGDSLWLSRYSGTVVLSDDDDGRGEDRRVSTGGVLECAGIMTRTEPYASPERGIGGEHGDGIDGNGDGQCRTNEVGYVTTVYSVFHAPTATHQHPVTVSAARFHLSSSRDSSSSSSTTAAVVEGGKVRSLDLDLPQDVVPAVVRGTIAPDSTTDGCALIGVTGCVAVARATFMTDQYGSGGGSVRGDEGTMPSKEHTEMAEVLASHVLGTYRLYHRRREASSSSFSSSTATATGISSSGGGGRGSRRSVFSPTVTRHGELDPTLPQSIHAASSSLLSYAVSLASASLVDDPTPVADPAVGGRGRTVVVSAGLRLEEKITAHETFVAFLLRAGIYRRLGVSGRMVLRDHGEMLRAVGGVLEGWQSVLKGMSDSSWSGDGEEEDRGWGMKRIQDGLMGMEEVVTDFPRRFRALQRRVLSTPDGSSGGEPIEIDLDDGTSSSSFLSSSAWATHQLCVLFSKSIDFAMDYRQARSEIVYDLSSVPPTKRGWGSGTDGVSGGCYPWTSDPEVLEIMEENLMALEKTLDDPVRYDTVLGGMENLSTDDTPDPATLVKKTAWALLEGHKDTTPSKRDEGKYDATKRTAVSLVQRVSSTSTDKESSNRDSENGSDLSKDLAFQLSLNHGYFEGVVSICHEHHEKSYTSVTPAPMYDLFTMLSPSRPVDPDDDQYDSLYILPDHITGLTFPKFVISWYAGRGMGGRMLELGAACPDILSEYMEEDDRLADLRWLQYLNVGKYAEASQSLMGLVEGGIISLNGGKGGSAGASPPSVEGRQLVLSLAKLSNLVRQRDNVSEDRRSVMALLKSEQKHVQMMKNNLSLIRAQKILAGLMDRPKSTLKTAMSAHDLISLALELIDTLDDAEKISQVCLAGLSIVSVLDPPASSTTAEVQRSEAALLWFKAINSDAERWSDMARKWKEMADDERIVTVCDTAFFLLARGFYSSMDDYGSRESGLLDTLGFKNRRVMEEALGMLDDDVLGGSNEQEGIDIILENVLESLI